MIGIPALWLPILLSAIAVFLASSLIHMMLPWHKSDYPKLPNEEAFRDAVRPMAIPPGDYVVPRASSMDDMRSPSFMEKMTQGPVIMMTVLRSGPPSMSSNLILWFLYSIVIGVFAAYVSGRALGPGAAYLAVFRFAGVTAFLGYAAALWQFSIWYHRSWLTTFKSTIDGLLYACLTAGFFGWLWPR